HWAFTTGHASNWHPLTWLSHALDCQLFGQRAGAHHLVSVVFHAANALLLFVVLRRMTGAVWRSGLVAALFALHPLHVESVAWVSERKDVLSGFFFLLTLWAYAGYVSRVECRGEGGKSEIPKDSALRVRRSSLYYGLALLGFGLGLMSKPMLVTLPFILLLLDYWPLGRVTGGECRVSSVAASGERQDFKLETVFRLVLEKLPFLALSVISSVVTFNAQQKGGAVSTSLTVGARVANAVMSYIRYLAKTSWPVKLSVLYPHPGHWPAGQVAGAAVILAAVFVAVLALARRRPYLAVGWLWFFGALVPVIGLVQVGIQSMADRYTYLPGIGLFMMVVWGVGELVLSHGPQDDRTFEWATGILAWAAVAVCAVLTEFQLRNWRDSEALFRHAVQVTKNNYLAYNNLGYYLSGRGKIAEAMENYRKSLEIDPNYEDARNNLGYALAGQKKYAEAIAQYEAALRIRPKHVEVHNNLGNALAEIGKTEEAMQHYRLVLEQKPDHADAHNNLGISLAMQGKVEEAIGHFQAAIRFKPNYASAHSNLGNALAAQHKLDEAIKEYQESLRLKPDDAQAHNNLGNVLAELGRADEAIQQYTEALRLNADNPEAHFNLGMVLVRQGKRQEAAAHYTEALRLKPDYTEARRQLESTPFVPRN
ncbi:MAG: hypothetical protein DME25_02015, partial [Verrucomicrobia bacterium]